MSNRDLFVFQFRAKFCLLFTPTRLSPNKISLDFPQGHAKQRGFVSTEVVFLQGISHNERRDS